MPDSDRCPEPGSRPTAWVLAAPGAGDNGQLRALVGLLEVDARWIERVDKISRVLLDRLTGIRARRIPRSKQARYRPPWPDLVLIAGGRAVIDALRIRCASGGKSRVVCLGRPWAPLRWFDLVVTTPQYRLPPADNLVTLDLPLNLPPRAPDDELSHWVSELRCLPRPLLGVLLGGDSGSYRFDACSAERIALSINRLAARANGSAVVVGSPRTPQKAIDLIYSQLEIPSRVYAWGPRSPNPYAAVLQLADALLVTSDSASMLAEACNSGRPVGILDLHERLRSRLIRRSRASMTALTGAVAKLTAGGFWVPARDMPELHRRAVASGRLSAREDLLSRPPSSGEIDDALAKVRERVYAVLDG